MNYQEAMEYMEKGWEPTALFRGWTATESCAEGWGDPQNDLKFVHIGNQRKGSTLAYISNILQAAGYRVENIYHLLLLNIVKKSRSESRRSPIRICAMVLEVIWQTLRAMVQDGFHLPTPLRSRRRWLLVFPGETVHIVVLETR